MNEASVGIRVDQTLLLFSHDDVTMTDGESFNTATLFFSSSREEQHYVFIQR